MTLQEEFTQNKVATITLGDKAHIGARKERDGLNVAPEDYHVYEIRNGSNRALMFAQTGDFYTNISSMDIAKLQSSDGASYGIADGDDAYKQGYNDMWDHEDITTSYVAPTNDGDSDYVVYSNKDRTAFLLDDENIYLKYYYNIKMLRMRKTHIKVYTDLTSTSINDESIWFMTVNNRILPQTMVSVL